MTPTTRTPKTATRATGSASPSAASSRYQQLRSHLSELKLTAAAEALPSVLDQATAEGLSLTVALERLCRGVVWSYSDPSVSVEYITEMLQFSRASSRYTALVTSGYSTIAALDTYGHYLDGISLELRAFDDAAYKRLTGVEHWRGILEVVAHARQRWSCHVEVTTRLHPNVNDSIEQIQALVGWVRETLGPNTPWHVLPGDAGASAAATVARARRLGHEAGLHYVYGPEPGQTTRCHQCGHTLIERGTTSGRVVGITDGRCHSCGADPQMRLSIFKR